MDHDGVPVGDRYIEVAVCEIDVQSNQALRENLAYQSIHRKPGGPYNRNSRFRDLTEVHAHRSRTQLGIDIQQLCG